MPRAMAVYEVTTKSAEELYVLIETGATLSGGEVHQAERYSRLLQKVTGKRTLPAIMQASEDSRIFQFAEDRGVLAFAASLEYFYD